MDVAPYEMCRLGGPLTAVGRRPDIIRAMQERELAALDAHQLLPRVLTEVRNAELGAHLFGKRLAHPMIRRLERPLSLPEDGFVLLNVDAVLDRANKQPPELTIAVLEAQGMAGILEATGRVAARGVAAVALDVSPLSSSSPYGRAAWEPRTREEVAELRAAAGRPLWVVGVLSAADAEVAAEAGADGVVLAPGLGARLGAPAVIDLLPEVIDAVGGTVTVVAGGPVRDGVDVLKYLAVGAEMVVVDSERPLDALASELTYAMRLTGCADLTDVGYHVLFAPLFGDP